jgi:transposase
MNDTIGIDISKDTLDTYWLSKSKHKQFANNKTGLRELIRWVRQAEASLAVFEATGVYHRLLEVSLAAHDLPFARVNPRQARRFAEGTGTLAKTDRVPSRRCKHRLPGNGCGNAGPDGVSSGVAS